MGDSSRGIIIVCGVSIGICLLIVVAIIVTIVVLLTPYVSISEYTAELRTDYGHNHILYSRDVTLSEYEWWSESAIDGVFFSRMFSNADDNTVAICNHVGDHDGCYQLSGSNTGEFTVPRAMSKVGKDVACPKIHKPVLPGSEKRDLSTCDIYEYDDGLFYRKDVVEHGSDLPVLRHYMSYTSAGVLEYNVTVEYTSFNDKTPSNKTGLKAPTKVYDFRNGVTVSGSGSSGKVSRLIEYFKSLFATSSVKRNPTAEAAMRRFEREREFRRRANLMPFPVAGGPAIGATPANVKSRDVTIPEEFDARKEFAGCAEVIGNITDQGSCGSCWAMSTAAVLSDRACINNISSDIFSPQYMMSCFKHQLSCNGGFIGTVWSDVREVGTVTEECYPFVEKDTDCPTKCENGDPISDSMLLKTKSFYSPWAETDEERVKAIQREIMEHGPVTVSMLVFSGFERINGNIYRRKSYETYAGGHMVRIIGWGTELGEDYWLVANSWGTDWNEHGFFKIRRGTNECNIENYVIAGLF